MLFFWFHLYHWGSRPRSCLFCSKLCSRIVRMRVDFNKTNRKKNNIRDRQVSNIRDTASCAMRELSGSRGAPAPIVTFPVATNNSITTVVPLTSLYHTSSPAISPTSLTQSSSSIFYYIILYFLSLDNVWCEGGGTTPMYPEGNCHDTSSPPGVTPGERVIQWSWWIIVICL